MKKRCQKQRDIKNQQFPILQTFWTQRRKNKSRYWWVESFCIQWTIVSIDSFTSTFILSQSLCRIKPFFYIYFLINQINKKKSRKHVIEACLNWFTANYWHGSIDEHHDLLHGFRDFFLLDHNGQTWIYKLVSGQSDVRLWRNCDFRTEDDVCAAPPHCNIAMLQCYKIEKVIPHE